MTRPKPVARSTPIETVLFFPKVPASSCLRNWSTPGIRGANIFGEVVGFGTTCDAGHITSPDEHGTGAAAAMQQALEHGRSSSRTEIDYINAHGTSTPLGDRAETRAIKNVFGSHAQQRQYQQHQKPTGAFAGSQRRHRVDPDHQSDSEEYSFHRRSTSIPPIPSAISITRHIRPKPRELTYAMSNSFGFGGHNASIIVRKFEA